MSLLSSRDTALLSATRGSMLMLKLMLMLCAGEEGWNGKSKTKDSTDAPNYITL